MRILFVCTANSCRSILSEAMFDHLAPPGFEAYSTGSQSSGRVHPHNLAAPEQIGTATHGLYNKGGEALEGAPPGIVITVCDTATGGTYLLYFGTALRAHWGLTDPFALDGNEALQGTASRVTLARIKQRRQVSLGLPFATLDHDQLKRELKRTGSL